MTVIRGVAYADDYGDFVFDAERLLVLLGDRLEIKRKVEGHCVGAFKGVGQIYVRATLWQRRATVTKRSTRSKFGDGEGADHDFETVEVSRERSGLTGNGPGPLLGLDLPKGMFDNAKQVGSRSGGRVERDDARIGEAERLAETLGQQSVYQADLSADNLDWRVVGASILA